MLNQTIERHEPSLEEWQFAEECGASFDAKCCKHHFRQFLEGKSQRYIQAFLKEIESQYLESLPLDWSEF